MTQQRDLKKEKLVSYNFHFRFQNSNLYRKLEASRMSSLHRIDTVFRSKEHRCIAYIIPAMHSPGNHHSNLGARLYQLKKPIERRSRLLEENSNSSFCDVIKPSSTYELHHMNLLWDYDDDSSDVAIWSISCWQ